MGDRPPLAKSELEVARVVWQLGQASVRQVIDALPADRAIDFKTVQTYLRRMEAKGYLKSHQAGRTKIYTPRVRPDRVVRQVVDDFVQRLFDGQSIPLFQHLLCERGVTDAELTELRELIDKLERGES